MGSVLGAVVGGYREMSRPIESVGTTDAGSTADAAGLAEVWGPVGAASGPVHSTTILGTLANLVGGFFASGKNPTDE